ncbi:cation transporter [Naasia sp. SYSU D00057]|uniref:cation transporter n=1 Tax=Naasia sp. SYSU D00057 TaxID=2817380 RepID=UPI0027DD16D3|nr:cation transporter [Naasia sp. SYSU D00057]
MGHRRGVRLTTSPVEAEDGRTAALRRTVLLVALLNLAYFGVEAAVAGLIGSVSLLADSIDFLEDTSINLLVFVASAWSLRNRSRAGTVLAALILVPTVTTLWTAGAKILDPAPPDAAPLTLTAAGALAVNLLCAVLLARHRRQAGSLARGAWLSARNDALANIAMIGAGLLTIPLASAWPDIAAGLGIGLLNAGAAWEVRRAARAERSEAPRA